MLLKHTPKTHHKALQSDTRKLSKKYRFLIVLYSTFQQIEMPQFLPKPQDTVISHFKYRH